jgi:hypothetical protein
MRFHRAATRFEEVAEILSLLEAEEAWAVANRGERRVLVEELLDELSLFPITSRSR